MRDTLEHRGPDDAGEFIDGQVAFAVRRLSVIDLEGGHQPISTPDGRFTIAFNGEIYNHRELRRCLESRGRVFRTNSDTECLVHAFAVYGPECLRHVDGMFALAIWDRDERQLFLARDRLGIKPLYVYDDGRSISFASELKALLADSIPRELDQEALAYYVRYGYVAAPATLLRHIRKLPAAHYMLCRRDNTIVRPFWTLSYVTDAVPEQELPERIYSALQRSVAKQLISDVPVGAFLSGGLDSSSIVRLMTDAEDRPVNTYSIGFAGPDDFYNELPDAARIAKYYGTTHHEIIVEPDVTELLPRLVRHLDQPLADSSFLVTYLLARAARESVTVTLSGVGGDEIFGGYRRYLGPRLNGYYDRLPRGVHRMAAWATERVKVDRGSRSGNCARLARAFVTASQLAPFEQYDDFVRLTTESQVAALLQRPGGTDSDLLAARRAFFDAPGDGDPITSMMHLDLKTSLPESLLLLTDSMTMAASLETRVPLLDHELVELLARIPSRYKIKGLTLRYLQKLSMRPHLPTAVFAKRKWGFGCPVGRWFRKELRELLRDTLAPTRLRQAGLFNPAVVEGIIEAHETSRADNTDILLGLLTFELWRQDTLG
jgi:asparagine synthase (glutamine-hydrolysing)